MRGLPLTAGSFAALSFASVFSEAGLSVLPLMSSTCLERSRSLPFASIRPGFSLPLGP